MDSLAVRLASRIAPVLLIAASVPAHAQAIDIRVTGEHTAATGEPPELSRQLAAIDAERQLQQQAVVGLQNLPAIKALNLPSSRLAAFIAALVEPDEAPTRTTATTGSTYRVDLHARLDPDDMRRRLHALRKDHDATSAVDDAWSRMQQLRQGMNEGRERAARALAALQLSARVAAALARTEENPGGGRVPSADGRARAKRLAETALALSPDSGDAHEAMGDVLNDADEPQAAEAEYRTALASDRDSARLHIKLAEALRLQGKLAEAVTELRTALARDADSARAHSDLGMILRGQRNLTEAAAEQKEAIRLDPDYVEAHNELAVALARQGRLAEAAAEFREMIRIDPDSAAGYFNLASVLADMDQDSESAAALREVVRINPNHYNAHYNLGELFRLDGKFDESVKQFREYLRLAPDTQQNRRNIQRARSLIEKFDNP